MTLEYRNGTLKFHIRLMFDASEDQFEWFFIQLHEYIEDAVFKCPSVEGDHITDNHFYICVNEGKNGFDPWDLDSLFHVIRPGFFQSEPGRYPILKGLLQLNWLNDLLGDTNVRFKTPWNIDRYADIAKTFWFSGYRGDYTIVETFILDLFHSMNKSYPNEAEAEEIHASVIEQKMHC